MTNEDKVIAFNHYSEMVKRALALNSKPVVENYFNDLSVKERSDVLIYAECKTPNQLITQVLIEAANSTS